MDFSAGRGEAILAPLEVIAVAWLAVAACSRADDDARLTLPYGTYDVTAPLCVSTGAPPTYPDAAHKATLLAFEDLTVHRLELRGLDVTVTLTDADCTVQIARRVFRNGDGAFSLQRRKSHVFTPEGCTFKVQAPDLILELGKAHGAPFADDGATAEDLPYDVTEVDGRFDLKTRDVAELNELWATYGCALPDRLQVTLKAPATSP